MEQRRKRTLGHKLEEELHFIFRRRGCNRIGTLNPLPVCLDAQCGVLPRDKIKFSTAADAELPQIGGEIDTLGNLCAVEFFVGNGHFTWLLMFQSYVKDPAASRAQEAETFRTFFCSP